MNDKIKSIVYNAAYQSTMTALKDAILSVPKMLVEKLPVLVMEYATANGLNHKDVKVANTVCQNVVSMMVNSGCYTFGSAKVIVSTARGKAVFEDGKKLPKAGNGTPKTPEAKEKARVAANRKADKQVTMSVKLARDKTLTVGLVSNDNIVLELFRTLQGVKEKVGRENFIQVMDKLGFIPKGGK